MKTPIIALSVLGTASIITATPIPGTNSNSGIKQRRNAQVNNQVTDIGYTSSTSLSHLHPTTLTTITTPTPTTTIVINTQPQPTPALTAPTTTGGVITTPPAMATGMVYTANSTAPILEESGTNQKKGACDYGLSPTNSWSKVKRFLGLRDDDEDSRVKREERVNLEGDMSVGGLNGGANWFGGRVATPGYKRGEREGLEGGLSVGEAEGLRFEEGDFVPK